MNVLRTYLLGVVKNPDDTFTGNDSAVVLVTLTGFTATEDRLREILCVEHSSLESAYEILWASDPYARLIIML